MFNFRGKALAFLILFFSLVLFLPKMKTIFFENRTQFWEEKGVIVEDTHTRSGKVGGKKKEGKKVYTRWRWFLHRSSIPSPYSLERGSVPEEAFILWLFVLSRERSAIFPPPLHPFSAFSDATRARTPFPCRRGENKNEKLDPRGENDFLPARLAFFHTAPPGPINTGNHRFSVRSSLSLSLTPPIYIYIYIFLLSFCARRHAL